MGEWSGKSVDRWGYLCYIGTRWDEYPIKVKDMILKEALEEKRAEAARAVSDFGSGNEVPQGV